MNNAMHICDSRLVDNALKLAEAALSPEAYEEFTKRWHREFSDFYELRRPDHVIKLAPQRKIRTRLTRSEDLKRNPFQLNEMPKYLLSYSFRTKTECECNGKERNAQCVPHRMEAIGQKASVLYSTVERGDSAHFFDAEEFYPTNAIEEYLEWTQKVDEAREFERFLDLIQIGYFPPWAMFNKNLKTEYEKLLPITQEIQAIEKELPAELTLNHVEQCLEALENNDYRVTGAWRALDSSSILDDLAEVKEASANAMSAREVMIEFLDLFKDKSSKLYRVIIDSLEKDLERNDIIKADENLDPITFRAMQTMDKLLSKERWLRLSLSLLKNSIVVRDRALAHSDSAEDRWREQMNTLNYLGWESEWGAPPPAKQRHELNF